ncbi:MAG: TetR/AcrR family transcriptional regulator [Deltaproteobacteria bacterium]|nr:TetR/AcrR family transcriptional regulator [Deltaproteobacteria bacterium]
MPKQTFLNLPPEKRERFINAAVDEFSSQPFRQASLTRLVANLGIAKGSIYQYFDHKLDLYRWLVLEEAERQKESHVQGALLDDSVDVYTRLISHYTAHCYFHLAEPRLARLVLGAREPTKDPELMEFHREVRERELHFLRTLLKRGQEAGEVNKDKDLDLITRLCHRVLVDGLTDALLAAIGMDIFTYLDAPFGAADALQYDDVTALVDECVDFVRLALAPSARIVGSEGCSTFFEDPLS